jgi:hypothetical protein
VNDWENLDRALFGYFAGIEFDPKPPLVWLVAPGLRFDPATETLLKYLSSEIQITRIGLNEKLAPGNQSRVPTISKQADKKKGSGPD